MKQFFNLVVPMAGRGSRFTEEGFKDSKPFIPVIGKPMIQRVIENLNFEFVPEFKTIILCQKSDYERYDFSIFKEIIGHNNIEIITDDYFLVQHVNNFPRKYRECVQIWKMKPGVTIDIINKSWA